MSTHVNSCFLCLLCITLVPACEYPRNVICNVLNLCFYDLLCLLWNSSVGEYSRNVTLLICNVLNSCFYDLMSLCLLWNIDISEGGEGEYPSN